MWHSRFSFAYAYIFPTQSKSAKLQTCTGDFCQPKNQKFKLIIFPISTAKIFHRLLWITFIVFLKMSTQLVKNAWKINFDIKYMSQLSIFITHFSTFYHTSYIICQKFIFSCISQTFFTICVLTFTLKITTLFNKPSKWTTFYWRW